MTKKEIQNFRDKYGLDIEIVDHWECPDDNGAKILSMPNIFPALHGKGLQPRTIYGANTWNFLRKNCYFRADYKSEISGIEPGKGRLHCLEAGTEVMTTSGFKPIEEVSEKDFVAQYNPSTKEISFVNPTTTVKTHVNKKVNIGYKNRFNVGYSDKHRMLIEHTVNYGRRGYVKNIEYKDVFPEDLRFEGSNRIPTAGLAQLGRHLTTDERIYIALNADGSFQYENNGLNYHIIRVKKERKKERLRKLLAESSLRNSQLFEKDRPEYLGYSIWTDKFCKDFWQTFNLADFSREMARDFIDELVKWDGWEGKRKNGRGKEFDGRCWYTTKQSQADFVQAVAALAGITTTVSVTEKPMQNHLPQISVEFIDRDSRGVTTMKRTVEETDEDMFCITVPTTYFVARSKDGYVFITGNCHELFKVDYARQESEFVRLIALSKEEHDFIHSGRLITLYKEGNMYVPKSYLLSVVENGFKIISDYNKKHQDEEPVRCYGTFLQYLRIPSLEKEMLELIKEYDIKFYNEVLPPSKLWKGWHVIVGNKRYDSPYKSQSDWEEAMKAARKSDYTRNLQNPFDSATYKVPQDLDNALAEALGVVEKIPGCKPGRISKRRKEEEE